MESKRGYVYILGNKNNTVLYIGVTSNLLQRISQHRQKAVEGFTKKYNLTKLLYVEIFDLIVDAIKREKEIKKWRREKKDRLIESKNPEYRDLAEELF